MKPFESNSWHLRLFVQAYIADRAWVDWAVDGGKRSGASLPETQAYQAAQAAFSAMRPGTPDSPEAYAYANTRAELDFLYQAMAEAQAEQGRAVRERYSARRASRLRRRLAEGRVSLCPYFWAVVWALAFYGIPYMMGALLRYAVGVPFMYLIGNPIKEISSEISTALAAALRPFGEWARKHPNLLDRIVVGLMCGAMLCVGGATAVQIAGQQWRDYQVHQAEKRAEEADKARQAREYQAWALAHPAEARREQQLQAEEHRRYALSQAKWQAEENARQAAYRAAEVREKAAERDRFFRELPGNVLGFFAGIGVFLVWTFVAVFSPLTVIAIVSMVCEGIGLLLARLPKREGRSMQESKPLPRWMRAIGRAYSVTAEILKDTWELVAAFYQAKHERWCPSITVRGELPT